MKKTTIKALYDLDRMWQDIDQALEKSGAALVAGKPGPEWFTAREFSKHRSIGYSTAIYQLRAKVHNGMFEEARCLLPDTRGHLITYKIYRLKP